MPTPRPAPAELAARRSFLLALHRRHAGRLRALFYWFGADLEVIDDGVLRSFLLAARHDPERDDPLPWLPRLALLAWRVASRPDRSTHNDLDPDPAIPSLPPAADLLARLLAVHAPTPQQRAAFVLAELGAVPLPQVAAALGRDPLALAGELHQLRRALADDREVIALGGPRPLLLASLAPFVDDPRWLRHHTRLLLDRLPRPPLSLREQLRRPPGILAMGLAAVALLLLLRPPPQSPPRPRPIPAPVVVARPIAAPPLAAPPLPLPVPTVMSPEPAPVARAVRKPRPPRTPKPDRLAEREQLAKARDPGAIIIELEMLGAGRKSLPQNPRQALAYAEQHARDYPQSQLASQRAELRVRALCALGRRDEARSEANRTQAPRVQEALRDACKP